MDRFPFYKYVTRVRCIVMPGFTTRAFASRGGSVLHNKNRKHDSIALSFSSALSGVTDEPVTRQAERGSYLRLSSTGDKRVNLVLATCPCVSHSQRLACPRPKHRNKKHPLFCQFLVVVALHNVFIRLRI